MNPDPLSEKASDNQTLRYALIHSTAIFEIKNIKLLQKCSVDTAMLMY
jgi:hypothetical protein